MRTRLKLFLDWRITFGKPYEISGQSARKVEYADRFTLEEEILWRQVACEEVQEEQNAPDAMSGGMFHVPGSPMNLEPFVQKQESTRG